MGAFSVLCFLFWIWDITFKALTKIGFFKLLFLSVLSISLLHKLRRAKYIWFGCLHASMCLDIVLPITLKQKTTDVWESKKRSVIWHCRFCITRHCPSFALVLSLQQHYQALIRNSCRLETYYAGSITYVACGGDFSAAYFTDHTSLKIVFQNSLSCSLIDFLI